SLYGSKIKIKIKGKGNSNRNSNSWLLRVGGDSRGRRMGGRRLDQLECQRDVEGREARWFRCEVRAQQGPWFEPASRQGNRQRAAFGGGVQAGDFARVVTAVQQHRDALQRGAAPCGGHQTV